MYYLNLFFLLLLRTLGNYPLERRQDLGEERRAPRMILLLGIRGASLDLGPETISVNETLRRIKGAYGLGVLSNRGSGLRGRLWVRSGCCSTFL